MKDQCMTICFQNKQFDALVDFLIQNENAQKDNTFFYLGKHKIPLDSSNKTYTDFLHSFFQNKYKVGSYKTMKAKQNSWWNIPYFELIRYHYDLGQKNLNENLKLILREKKIPTKAPVEKCYIRNESKSKDACDQRDKWLSNVNLVMYGYRLESLFPNFYFGASHYYDFYQNIPFSSFDQFLEDLPQNTKTRYIGFVLNTASYVDGVGVHWFAVFIDLKKKGVELYDPAGKIHSKHNQYQHIVREICLLCTRILRKKFHTNETIVLKDNTHAQQKYPGECGIYCLYFIENRLKGHSFNQITNRTNIPIISYRKRITE